MANPLLTIARFEFFYQFRQPVYYAFVLLSFGQGLWYSYQIESYYAYADPAVTAYLVLSSLGSGLASAVVLLAGQSLTKDLDFCATSYLYSLPITSRLHFAGRFLGVFASALLLGLCYPVGVAAYFISAATTVPWFALLDGFVRLVAENIFIVSSITFVLTVWLRSLRGAYVALLLVVFYFLLTEQAAADTVSSDLWQLLDPFGVDMARESAGNLPVSDDPTDFLSFVDLLFVNRILWLGFALGLLAQAESRFSFHYFMAQPGGTRDTRSENNRSVSPSIVGKLPAVDPRFTPRVTLATLLWLVRWEVRALLAQPLFSLTAGLLIGLTVLLATVLQVNPDFPTLPTTAQMTALRLPMDLFIGAFLLIMTTEVLFRERTIRFWPIYNALPQASFVLLLPRLGALVVASAAFTGILFLTGVCVQLSHNFPDIDWHRYASDLLGDSFPRYCQLICLGACVSSLVNDRLRSHLVNLLLFGLFVFMNVRYASDSGWFSYSFLPGSTTYSDLTGYGSATPLRLPVQLLWWAVAMLLLTGVLITWNRGVDAAISQRSTLWLTRVNSSYCLPLVIGAVSAIGLAIWHIYHIQHEPLFRPVAHYKTHHVHLTSPTGHRLGLHIQYHHPYQIQHMVQATIAALNKGEQLFGPYPFRDLSITEYPAPQPPTRSAPGRIWLSEQHGWIADNQQPAQTDYIDYVLAKEIFRQWLDHRLQPANTAGSGFIQTGLPEYLALQRVRDQYGDDRLRDRLAQRAITYTRNRRAQHTVENCPVLSIDDATDRYRTPALLASIGQIWGDKPLSYTISQFYRATVNKPGSATAVGFAQMLASQLPDSLAYLQTYLTDRLEFDLKIGDVTRFADGLQVRIRPLKWRVDPSQKRLPVPATDYLPLVLLDADDKTIYRRLVRLETDQSVIVLPALANARKVTLDPIGIWPEPTKRDNAKIL